jgi:hypothetical protein
MHLARRGGAMLAVPSLTMVTNSASSHPNVVGHSIGELCVGGDWACAHGDFGALGNIARTLADGVDEPLHCALVALADACVNDPERAATAWWNLKTHIWQSLRA